MLNHWYRFDIINVRILSKTLVKLLAENVCRRVTRDWGGTMNAKHARHISDMCREKRRGPSESTVETVDRYQSSWTFFFPKYPCLQRGTPRAPQPRSLLLLPFQDDSFHLLPFKKTTHHSLASSSSSPGLLSRDRSDASSVSHRDLRNSPDRNSAADQGISRSPLLVRRALACPLIRSVS